MILNCTDFLSLFSTCLPISFLLPSTSTPVSLPSLLLFHDTGNSYNNIHTEGLIKPTRSFTNKSYIWWQYAERWEQREEIWPGSLDMLKECHCQKTWPLVPVLLGHRYFGWSWPGTFHSHHLSWDYHPPGWDQRRTLLVGWILSTLVSDLVTNASSCFYTSLYAP